MKYLIVLTFLAISGCTNLKLDVNDADLACAGNLEKYTYRDKGVSITVECKAHGGGGNG